MINHRAETLLTLADVARRYKKHIQSVYGWVNRGVRVKGGHRVRLETITIGTMKTSEEALDRFFAACSKQHAPLPRSPAQKRRAHESATKELEAAGW